MNTNTPAWARRYKTTVEASGVTFTAMIVNDEYGWTVQAWSRHIGQPTSLAEGNPIIRRTFDSREEAYALYSNMVVEAIETPPIFVDQTRTRVAPEIQNGIDRAGKDDGIEERPRNQRRLK